MVPGSACAGAELIAEPPGRGKDLAEARLDLARALAADSSAPSDTDRLHAARRVLIRCGCEVAGIDPAAAPALDQMVARAASAAASPARRVFAVLILDALAQPELLRTRSRARLDRDICALAESTLPDVLQRAGYPFGGDPDAKRRALSRLAASIDDYLRPPEPTFPAWLSGLPER